MFNESDFDLEKGGDAIITPVRYNKKTLEPYKNIILKYNHTQDNANDLVKELLDSLLKDPENHTINPGKMVMVRGIF